jgi:ketosteroid isomerase-like protein
MADTDVAIVRRALAASLARPPDVEALLELLSADVVLTSDWGIEQMRYEHVDGFLQALGDTGVAFDPWQQEVDEIIDAGERGILVLLHLTARGRESGVPVDNRWALLVELEQGRIVSGRAFIDRERALAAAGLAG